MNEKDYKEIAKIINALRIITKPNETVKDFCFIISMKLADQFEKNEQSRYINECGDTFDEPQPIIFDKKQFLKECGVK